MFNLYNKQGKHLNAEEIRNALYHGLDLVRGLLVAAGDSAVDDSDARKEVADFLAPTLVWSRVGHLGDTLRSYDFGTSRYRRTKVLSWLAATLLSESPDADPKLPSTSRHIDSLLQRVEADPADPLHDKARVADLLVFLSDSVAAHAAVVEAWAGRFMDNSRGDKWQELQLVGSMAGVCIAAAVLGEETEARLADRAARLEERSAERAWLRPAKTQTQEQWRYIARIALWVADELGVGPMAADRALRQRFGSSGVSTLQSIYAADPATIGMRGGPSRVGPESAASGDDVDR